MHEAVKGEVQSLPQEAVIPLATTQRPRSVSARPISTDVNRWNEKVDPRSRMALS